MLTHMNVNSPNTTSVHEIAMFSPSVWCSQLVQWLQEKFCLKMWRRRSVPLIVLSLCLNFYFAAGIFLILKPRGVLLFELLLLWVLTPPWGSGDLGGQSFAGFPWLRGLWCIECAESLEWRAARGSQGRSEMQQLTQGLNREGWADTGLAHQYYCLSNIMRVTVFILKINILSFSVQYNNNNNAYDKIIHTIIIIIIIVK